MSLNKKKKQNKKKLSSLILLLFLTIILLTTSTYAWFTANKTVRIEDIDVNVGVAGGIQISSDALNWKTILSNTDITTGYSVSGTNDINMFTGIMTPVSTIQAVNSSHLLNMYRGVVEADDDDADEAGRFELTTELITEAAADENTDFIAFDIFLKLDNQADVYLGIGSGTVANGISKGLENAARIALVTQGTVPSTNSQQSMVQLAGAGNSDIIILEPNSDAHTAYGVAQAHQYYENYSGVSSLPASGTSTVEVGYDGVKAAISESDNMPLAETNVVDNSSFFDTVTTTKLQTTFVNGTSGNNLLLYPNLSAGVTKIRVYMWVEGQDVDCENQASGSDLTYRLTFTVNPTTASS